MVRERCVSVLKCFLLVAGITKRLALFKLCVTPFFLPAPYGMVFFLSRVNMIQLKTILTSAVTTRPVLFEPCFTKILHLLIGSGSGYGGVCHKI